MVRILILIFVIVLNIIIHTNCTPQSKDSHMNKITKLPSEDENLQKYQDTAQAQIDYLIEFMNTHEKGDSLFQYFVKMNFQEGDLNEHMWVEVNSFEGNYFIGVLSNEPAMIKQLKYGDTVRVKKENVEDWLLNDYLTNTKVGGFSQEYLRKKGQ